MKSQIVCKFGGTSVANATQINKVKDIVLQNKERQYVVVSAPGKDSSDAEKLTDHLINIATDGRHFRSQSKEIDEQLSYQQVIGKFQRLIADLGIEGKDIIEKLEKDIKKPMHGDKRKDFLASRGERYNAEVVCRYFNKQSIPAELVLPEDMGLVVSEDYSNAAVIPVSYRNIREKLSKVEAVSVIPGFYGVTARGDVAVFSRGGSDLTGGEIAFAVEAALYENWTDTDGIYQVDPRLIPEAKVISRLTYKEIRLLSSKGFDVFHYDAMVNCKKRNIPIQIRNTNNLDSEGTLIVSERVPKEVVVGIARKDNIAYLYIERDGAGETIGFVHDLLSVIKDYGIETYHYPTDRDDVAILLNQNDMVGYAEDIKETIEKEFRPDKMEFIYNLTILSPVGIGMKNHPGVIAEAATALKEQNINIDIINQGPAQISFHFGFQNFYAENALKAMYKSLIK
ncbi:MAG TPA: aspartate kinase [Syntrophaceae bacterium]|jgi:aspartate kinase|nr:aspartate kinase [Syntrophaceae bacterium]HCX02449.1 aspartate kinase [Syntrophaceae bacterium]